MQITLNIVYPRDLYKQKDVEEMLVRGDLSNQIWEEIKKKEDHHKHDEVFTIDSWKVVSTKETPDSTSSVKTLTTVFDLNLTIRKK